MTKVYCSDLGYILGNDKRDYNKYVYRFNDAVFHARRHSLIVFEE